MQSGHDEVLESLRIGKNAKNQSNDMLELSINHSRAMRKQRSHSDTQHMTISEIR